MYLQELAPLVEHFLHSLVEVLVKEQGVTRRCCHGPIQGRVHWYTDEANLCLVLCEVRALTHDVVEDGQQVVEVTDLLVACGIHLVRAADIVSQC